MGRARVVRKPPAARSSGRQVLGRERDALDAFVEPPERLLQPPETGVELADFALQRGQLLGKLVGAPFGETLKLLELLDSFAGLGGRVVHRAGGGPGVYS